VPAVHTRRTASADPRTLQLRRWLYASHGRLGDDSVLWGKRILDRSQLREAAASASPEIGMRRSASRVSTAFPTAADPFHVGAYKFSVFVPARIRDSASEKRALDDLLAREAPAHTAVDVRYVEPRFRVGVQASIGLDAVIARTPCGGGSTRRGCARARCCRASRVAGRRAPAVARSRPLAGRHIDRLA